MEKKTVVIQLDNGIMCEVQVEAKANTSLAELQELALFKLKLSVNRRSSSINTIGNSLKALVMS